MDPQGSADSHLLLSDPVAIGPMRLPDDKLDMAQHKSLNPRWPRIAGRLSLRETGSNLRGAAAHTTILCEQPHVLFNNALLYSGHRFEAGSALSGVTT